MSAPGIPEQRPPALTVAMPVFNAGPQLRLALLSITHQSFADWELLLIDDGSTDHAVDDVSDIVDSRIRVIRDGKNRGLAARLNETIDLARGEFFARMDQDDISHPERFAKQLAVLRLERSVDLVGAKCLTISESNEIIGALPWRGKHDQICRSPWLGFHLPHPTWMGRTSWFRKHRYAVPGPYCCEDQEMLLRTHLVSRFYVLPEYLLAYRLRDRFNFAKVWRTRKTLYQIQQKYFIGRKDYLSAGLALAGFCLRVAKDIRPLVSQFFPLPGGKASQRSPVFDSNTEAWHQIIQGLREQKQVGAPSIGAK